MTRKDTIIIAVLVNTGLLAVLFAMAILTDDEKLEEPTQNPSTALVEAIPQISTQSQPIEVAHYEPQPTSQTPVDEVDSALNEFVSQSVAYHGADQINSLPSEEEELDNTSPTQTATATASKGKQFVEVTVKKGDALEKIAKANATTVAAIKKANDLKSERLNIGQVLKIPTSGSTKTSTTASTNQSVTDSTGAVYYTVKSGDNPWTIAKQFGVNYEDLLKLNNMTKDSARSLKIGDKIRVK